MRAFIPKGGKFPVVTSDNKKMKPWRQEIAGCAIQWMQGGPSEKPVTLRADFYFERPKSQKKAEYKSTKPDIDKLGRAVLDALTGIVFRDDSQVIDCTLRKFYGTPARMDVQVVERH